MTFLHADRAIHSSANENSLVLRLDLGNTRVLFMGDAEAGGRQPPATPPSAGSIEGALLACCTTELAADVLVVGHYGSRTSSRRAFLDAAGASVFIVSSGPMQYGSVTLPDADVITELDSRGAVFRTDVNDPTCRTNPAKTGPDNDGRAGGCDHVRVTLNGSPAVQAAVVQVVD
jgi:beta-lactamase superfamily II metal-dependent hydrolase